MSQPESSLSAPRRRWRPTLLDIGFAELRRVQFDIERGRDSTLVVVPEHMGDEPELLSVPIAAKLREVSEALAFLGERLNEGPGNVRRRGHGLTGLASLGLK